MTPVKLPLQTRMFGSPRNEQYKPVLILPGKPNPDKIVTQFKPIPPQPWKPPPDAPIMLPMAVSPVEILQEHCITRTLISAAVGGIFGAALGTFMVRFNCKRKGICENGLK